MIKSELKFLLPLSETSLGLSSIFKAFLMAVTTVRGKQRKAVYDIYFYETFGVILLHESFVGVVARNVDFF